VSHYDSIEHLHEDALRNFAPVLLGSYHPRMLLITTPSYTFNARFTPPNAPAGARKGFLDPTSRTDRIFRHDDHKFEWTVEEFTSWCRETAEQWNYEVDIGGVGLPQEVDPYGRDSELGFASQTAAFRRKEGAEYVKQRSDRCKSLGLLQTVSNQIQHVLLANCHHTPHLSAKHPAPLLNIAEAVMTKMNTNQAPIRELFLDKEISMLCGGWVEVLVAAVLQHEGLDLTQVETENGSRWGVLYPGFVPRPASPMDFPSDAGRLDEDDGGSSGGDPEETHGASAVSHTEHYSTNGGSHPDGHGWDTTDEEDSWGSPTSTWHSSGIEDQLWPTSSS